MNGLMSALFFEATRVQQRRRDQQHRVHPSVKRPLSLRKRAH